MKRFAFISLLIMSLFSCNASKKKMLELPLLYVSYHYGSQMISIPSFSMRFFVEDGKVYAVVFDQDTNKSCRYLIKQEGAMDKLRQVIKDKKIYTYKDHYNNPHVLDGNYWSFEARFGTDTEGSERQTLSSSGSNAGPRGNGLSTLSLTMKSLMENAELMYVCDAEGYEIPNVPIEAVRNPEGDIDYLYLIYNEYYRRYDYRFHDLDQSETFKAQFAGLQPSESLKSIELRAEMCFGARIIDEGKQGLMIYFIVDNGAIESLPLLSLVKGEAHTTRFSQTQGLVDVRLVDGQVMGVDKQGQEVSIEWE